MGNDGGFIALVAAHAFRLSLPPETNHRMMKKLIRTSMVPRICSLLRKSESNERKRTAIVNLSLTSVYFCSSLTFLGEFIV